MWPFVLGFKGFEASAVLKSSCTGRSFAWTSFHTSLSWTAPLLQEVLQEEHDLSVTLGTRSLEVDCKREEVCIDSLLQFRSNLKDLRDHFDILLTSICLGLGAVMFAFPVQSISFVFKSSCWSGTMSKNM